jgi:hypothetical protein
MWITCMLREDLGHVCDPVPSRPGWPAMAWPLLALLKWCKCSFLSTWPNRAELDGDCVFLACTDGCNDPGLQTW